ncbi:MAG: sugar isomerase [Candidatus Onthomonas sp.]
MRAKRSIYNIIFGILNQAVTIAAGILLPRLVLVSLGSESNGLLNSVNQIFTYFALLEAGVGTATLQALYAPIANNDRDSINGILAATDRYYKRTGVVYLLAFLLLSIIYPLIVDSELTKSTIFFVIVLTGFSGVLSYFFQGKYNILLLAEGKSYIGSNLSLITYILTSASKIVLLLHGFDVVALQAMYCFFNIIKMAYIEWYMHRNYQWIDLKATPDFQAISQKNFVLIHQISSLIFNNTDTLILTVILGLKSVSVYSMYTLLFGMVNTLIGTITGSVQFILGQTFKNDREKYVKLLDTYEAYSMALVFSLYSIANIFILPFMELYTSGVSDINYLDQFLLYLFVTVYLLNTGRESSNLSIKFAGHFKQTVNRTILEATINLSVSIFCVFRFGIYGVLSGTIAALLYRANDMIIYANKKILKRSPWITYRRWLLNLAMFVCVTVGAKFVFSHVSLESYGQIILWAIVCCVILIPLFLLAVSLAERETYRYAKLLVRPYLDHIFEKFLKT